MALVGAKKIGQTANNQINKAEELLELMQNIIDKISLVDEEIEHLVRGGIQGKSVENMSSAYIQNRESIDAIVQRLSLAASLVKQNAELSREKEQEAIDAIYRGKS